MQKLQCDLCGGSLLMDDGGDFALCESCGMKFKRETVKKMIVELNGPVQVEGIANIENLLARAKEFEKVGDLDKAVEYYNNVLDLDINHVHARGQVDFLSIPRVGTVVQARITKIDEFGCAHAQLANGREAFLWIRIPDEDVEVTARYIHIGDVFYTAVRELSGRDGTGIHLAVNEEILLRISVRRREAEEWRRNERRTQGLCVHCGGSLNFFRKCDFCGKRN